MKWPCMSSDALKKIGIGIGAIFILSVVLGSGCPQVFEYRIVPVELRNPAVDSTSWSAVPRSAVARAISISANLVDLRPAVSIEICDSMGGASLAVDYSGITFTARDGSRSCSAVWHDELVDKESGCRKRRTPTVHWCQPRGYGFWVFLWSAAIRMQVPVINTSKGDTVLAEYYLIRQPMNWDINSFEADLKLHQEEQPYLDDADLSFTLTPAESANSTGETEEPIEYLLRTRFRPFLSDTLKVVIDSATLAVNGRDQLAVPLVVESTGKGITSMIGSVMIPLDVDSARVRLHVTVTQPNDGGRKFDEYWLSQQLMFVPFDVRRILSSES